MYNDISNMQKKNRLLNCLKGLGCIGVVFIHVQFPGIFGTAVFKLSQFAVPVFFMISGYFAYSIEDNSIRLKKRLKHICVLLAFSVAIYVCYTVTARIRRGSLNEWAIQFLDIRTWINIIFLSDFNIISAGHLYFLPCLAYGYLLLMAIGKTHSWKVAYKSIPFLMILHIAVYSITLTYNLSWHLRGNFIMVALPYILIGNYIAYKQDKLNKISNWVAAVSAATGGVLALVLTLLDCNPDISEIGIVSYAVSIFVLAIKNPNFSLGKMMEILGEKYSAYIYIIHIAVNGIVSYLPARLTVLQCEWYRPIVVFLISLVLSMVFFEVGKNKLGARKR